MGQSDLNLVTSDDPTGKIPCIVRQYGDVPSSRENMMINQWSKTPITRKGHWKLGEHHRRFGQK